MQSRSFYRLVFFLFGKVPVERGRAEEGNTEKKRRKRKSTRGMRTPAKQSEIETAAGKYVPQTASRLRPRTTNSLRAKNNSFSFNLSVVSAKRQHRRYHSIVVGKEPSTKDNNSPPSEPFSFFAFPEDRVQVLAVVVVVIVIKYIVVIIVVEGTTKIVKSYTRKGYHLRSPSKKLPCRCYRHFASSADAKPPAKATTIKKNPKVDPQRK